MNTERPATPQDVFTRLAAQYDAINAVASIGFDTRWRKQATFGLPPAGVGTILDLCCGTGAMGTVLRQRYSQARIIGFDVNLAMLDVAAEKRTGVYSELQRAAAERLPLETNSVDLVTISLGFHDLADRQSALQEIYRVLRPGGKVLLLELTLPDKPLGRRMYLGLLKGAMSLRNMLGLRHLGHVMDEVVAAPPHTFIWDSCREAGFRVDQQRSHGGGLMTSYIAQVDFGPNTMSLPSAKDGKDE